MLAIKYGVFLFLFLVLSPSSAAKDNSILFAVPAEVQQDKFGKYALLLPVLPRHINVNTTFTLKDAGKELAADFSLLNTWPTIAPQNKKMPEKFIRLLLIEISATDSLAKPLTLSWQNQPSAKPLKLSFKTIPSNIVLVYPTSAWLAEAVLLHQASDRDSAWYIEPQKKYANYVTNQSLLSEKGYSKQKASQWLYDRPQAIYQLFVMSGQNKWLTQANELSDFYIENIDGSGLFVLKKSFDPKYLMPKGLLYRYLLSGDEKAKAALTRIYQRSFDWDENYSLGRGFWTERNQAAALNVAISYWELTSDTAALQRINDIVDATVAMTFNPKNGWPLRGCPQHSFKSHEGWGDDSPACSPWMMALLGDALWRFYMLTGDTRAASLIDAFGDFILNYGIYYGNKRVKNIVIPKYIVSIENAKQEELDQWTNPQHACDVAALLGKSAYIKQQNNQDDFLVKTLFNALIEQCAGSYSKWQAELKQQPAKTYWEIKPLRRFAWMYSTTSDLPWLTSLILGSYWRDY